MRSVEFHVIIQRNNVNKDKYYPKLLSATISETFPWTPSQAQIEIDTNVSSGTAGYVSPIRADDIIRLQANVRYSESEKSIWEDLYEGRIIEIGSGFKVDNNSTVLGCKGHSNEMVYTLITADYSASAATTGAMLEALRALYSNRLSAGQIDTAGSTAITSYNVKGKTKYMVDVIRHMEQLESYTYRFHTVRTYDSDGDLSTVYASWQALTSVVSSNLKIIEGTPRFISADFSSSIASLVNDVTVYGAEGTPQKEGAASDATSIAAYGKRSYVETDTTLATDVICGAIAEEIKERLKDPIVSGSATVMGEVHVEPGDLVYCKIPSLEINGASIDGNYRVRRVSHSINADGWTTSLDLGEIQLSASDIIASIRDRMRLNNSYFIS